MKLVLVYLMSLFVQNPGIKSNDLPVMNSKSFICLDFIGFRGNGHNTAYVFYIDTFQKQEFRDPGFIYFYKVNKKDFRRLVRTSKNASKTITVELQPMYRIRIGSSDGKKYYLNDLNEVKDFFNAAKKSVRDEKLKATLENVF